MKKPFKIILFSICLLIITLSLFVRLTTYHPDDVEFLDVACPQDAPVLQKNNKIKILSWNIQFLAGKNYIFFFDEENNTGPDTMPLKKDIEYTLQEVVRIIKDENPDIVLFQEVDHNAKRTYHEDQLEKILSELPQYNCHSSAMYWQALYVPHPKINGSVGMKLSTISKYKIQKAVRYQLPVKPSNFIFKNFELKRAVLETAFFVEQTPSFSVFNTHFDAFAQGSDTMERQVEKTKNLLFDTTKKGNSWIIGGDFNLLATKSAYEKLKDSQKYLYKPESELKIFFEKFNSMPSISEIDSHESEKWFTHFPNDSDISEPDRTIDYIFYSDEIKILEKHVRQNDTQKISDHLPLVMSFTIK